MENPTAPPAASAPAAPPTIAATLLHITWLSVLLGLVTQAINEILFPVGCALVLFAAGTLAKRMQPDAQGTVPLRAIGKGRGSEPGTADVSSGWRADR